MASKLALAIGLPLVAAVTWGAFVAPNASVDVPGAVALALQIAVFGGAAAALFGLGRSSMAQAFAVVVVANAGLMVALGQ